ncbi:hypothetical protein D3C85_1287630 [compost metagenome]
MLRLQPERKAQDYGHLRYRPLPASSGPFGIAARRQAVSEGIAEQHALGKPENAEIGADVDQPPADRVGLDAVDAEADDDAQRHQRQPEAGEPRQRRRAADAMDAPRQQGEKRVEEELVGDRPGQAIEVEDLDADRRHGLQRQQRSEGIARAVGPLAADPEGRGSEHSDQIDGIEARHAQH